MENYIQITFAVLGIVIAVLGVVWVKWTKGKKLLKELAEALTILSAAVEDDQVTQEEIDKLIEEFKEVVVAAGELVSK